MCVNGRNKWMWAFQTDAVTYFAAYKGRARKETDATFPVKTKQKVSGRFRSDDGLKNYTTLMSIALIAKKNNQNPFFAFQKLAAYYGK